MTLYFAYGSNMIRAAMAVRCPSSHPLGVARMFQKRWIITRDGYASVSPDVWGMTYGVLWNLASCDESRLDRYEQVDTGLYFKATLPVLSEQGSRQALVYIASSCDTGSPKPGYVEGVAAAAESWSFPASYIREIEAWSEAQPENRPNLHDSLCAGYG
jgi:cation transport regulator ChaC